jgi:hypothetical protein
MKDHVHNPALRDDGVLLKLLDLRADMLLSASTELSLDLNTYATVALVSGDASLSNCTVSIEDQEVTCDNSTMLGGFPITLPTVIDFADLPGSLVGTLVLLDPLIVQVPASATGFSGMQQGPSL